MTKHFLHKKWIFATMLAVLALILGCLLHATTSSLGMSSNRYVDGEKHTLQLIPLSPAEARFLAHTAFWLGHLKSMPTQKNYPKSFIHSSHERGGMLDWQIDKQPPHRIQGMLWDFHGISERWRGDYDEETQLNLTHFLLTQALPKHLGKRWEQPNRIDNSPYDFAGTRTIPSSLRGRCRSAITAASPEIYKQLIAEARATSDLPREIADWLVGFP